MAGGRGKAVAGGVVCGVLGSFLGAALGGCCLLGMLAAAAPGRSGGFLQGIDTAVAAFYASLVIGGLLGAVGGYVVGVNYFGRPPAPAGQTPEAEVARLRARVAELERQKRDEPRQQPGAGGA
ncbi:MAG TPA: hypothetical protein VGF55_28560 [Gemmataceae bacterium]